MNQRGYCADEFERLVQDCQLFLDPESSKVNTSAFVTDLTAHAWVATAQIYLHARLLRKSRRHADVQAGVKKLAKCIQLLPFRGPLFTAQAPFFPIFILGLVTIGEDRNVAREWFETICSAASERSSVPPTWASLQRIWAWMDAHADELKGIEDADAEMEEVEASSRLSWWELTVDWILRNEGHLSLV